VVSALVILNDTDHVYGTFEFQQVVDRDAVWQIQLALPEEIGAAYNPSDRPISAETTEVRQISIVLHPFRTGYGDGMQLLAPYTHYITVTESMLPEAMNLSPFTWLTPRTWDHNDWRYIVQQDRMGRIFLPMGDIITMHRRIHGDASRAHVWERAERTMRGEISRRVQASTTIRKTPTAPKGPAIGRGKRKLGI
jgi:hypothetical protein